MGRLQDKRLFLLDMDGTIYLDDRLFDGVTAFLSRIREKGGRYLFLTNNSSKGVEGYIEKLNGTCDREDGAEILLSGFDRELTFQKLEDACILLNRGVTWLATNPDWVCPTWYGAVPDCGSVCEMLHRATGREPEFIGKPRPAMVQLALERTGYPPEAAVLLGDRLYTDIACAVNAGIDSVFVLSGEGTRDDIERDGIRPTWVYDDINAVFRAWEETP